MYNWSKVDEMLAAATVRPEDASSSKLPADLVAPGMSCLVSRGGDVLYRKSFGCRSIVPEVTALSPEMVFDVASLTKALVTTTLAMKLVEKGRLDIDKPVAHYIQSFSNLGKGKILVRDLLNHSAGFPDHRKFYLELEKVSKSSRAGILKTTGARDFVYKEIYRSELSYPPRSQSIYSDIGFIVLGGLLELLWHSENLEKVAQKEIFSKLGLRATGFVDLTKKQEPVAEMIVPSVACPWRKQLICGEVNDENCWAMGGVAGHAGMFSTLDDLFTLSQELLDCFYGRGKLVSQSVIQDFWKLDDSVPDSTWALGWDTPTEGKSSSGRFFAKGSVGHLGYTGCSLWIDPSQELIVTLLSNRLHPRGDNKKIKEFRPYFHDLVMHTLGLAA